MRNCSPRRLLPATLLALLLAAPAARAEVTYGGNLGLTLTQQDTWGAGASSSSRIVWFTGGLRLDASLFSPGTLTLGAWGDYKGYRASGGSASDGLNYGLRLGALGRTPLRLGAEASRSTTEFTSDSSNLRTGSTRVDSASASAALVQPDLPFLSATVRNSAIVNRSLGNAPVRSDSTTLALEAAQSVDSANYRLTYDTGWASGDYAESNYRNHLVTFQSMMNVSAEVTAKVDATYFLRSPTLASALNPRIDTQTVTSWFRWYGGAASSGGGGYTYSSALFEVPGEPVRESIAHAVNAYGSRQLNDELGLDLTAGATSAQTRASGVTVQSTGEQVSSGLRWARQGLLYRTSASLAAGVGGFQAQGGESSVAWNVAAGAGASRPVSTWQLATSLNASYDSNTGANAGSRARVLGTVTASGEPLGWSVTNLLNLGWAHTDSPYFGARRVIDARLVSQAFRGGYVFQFNAGLTDDLSEVLVPGAAPVTSLVPVDFNTQSRYAILSATVPTIRRLSLSVVGRHVSFTAPGRGTQWESGVTVSVGYVVGAFSISLYDQVTTGGSSSGAAGTQNLLFLSITRSFGR